MAHKLLRVDAAILVARASRCQDRLIDLEVIERAGSCSLALPKVRGPERYSVLDEECNNKDIQDERIRAFAGTRKHIQRKLQTLSAMWPSESSSSAGNVLRHESVKRDILEGISSIQRQEVDHMLNDAGEWTEEAVENCRRARVGCLMDWVFRASIK